MNGEHSVLDPFVHLLAESTGLSEDLLYASMALLEVLVIIGVSVAIAWAFKSVVLERLERWAAGTANDVDDRLVYFVRRFYNLIVGFLVTVAVLQIFGIEITPLVAGAGIAGVAVAYAGKDLLGNMIAGGVLLVDQPIKIGDRIQIEKIGSEWGSWGDVVDIGLRTTTVRNTDGVYVTYPNAKLADSVINNFSPSNAPVRFRVRVLVSLDCDLQAALACLEDVARNTPGILLQPGPQALVRALYDDEGGHAHHGALLELRCWVEDIRVRTVLRSTLLLGIHKAFRTRGFTFGRLEVLGSMMGRDAA